MKSTNLSMRLTRAGAAFVVFGLVASSVPNTGLIPASACGGGGSNNTGGVVAGVVLTAGAVDLAIQSANKNKKQDKSPTLDTSTNNGIGTGNSSVIQDDKQTNDWTLH